MAIQTIPKMNLLRFLKYQFYHRLAYIFINLFAKDKITYSQIKEDLIIDILTGFKKTGVYVDIGANHPDHINITKKFYERGWRGINIEPHEEMYKLLCQKRPGDINLNIGIGQGEGTYHYYESLDGSVSSTCSVENVAEKNYISGFKIKKINLVPLRKVFENYNLNVVDFINIDVEGFENEVLKSNDWNRYKAKVLCIEGRGYDEFLKPFGYKKVLFDGLNSYYKLKNQFL